MLLKKKKTTNGTRHQLIFKKFLLCKNSRVVKTLILGSKSSQGRGFSSGKITVGHKGGGQKNLFRKIDLQICINFSILLAHMYDPKRSSFLSLCFNFYTKKFFNNLSTHLTYPGSFVFSYYTYPESRIGSCAYTLNTPTGSIIHSISKVGEAKYIKSAGTFGVLLNKDNFSCTIKLPSGILKKFPVTLICTLGSIANGLHSATVVGKAGRARLCNRRPHVRGVAMNPVDHPHGGQTSGGIPSVTPWGLPTKGRATRKKKYVKS